MELDVMKWLNDNNIYRPAYYECGPELGVLHIWWQRSSWQTKWITVEPCPIGDSKPAF